MTDSPTEPPRAARPLVAAGALFADDAGRVLLVRPTYKQDWDIPGGYVEAGETPRQACEREIFEELGIRVEIGRLLAIDWAPHPEQGDKVLFIFDGGRLGEGLAGINFRDGEISAYEFVEASELSRRVIPRLARRIMASLSARLRGSSVYLEFGETDKPEAS